MRNPESVCRYLANKLEIYDSPNDWPIWFRDAALAEREAIQTNDPVDHHREKAISDQNCVLIERYGRMGESLDIWRHDDWGWMIDWWDLSEHVMSILIDNPIDYANFQASWVCPMVAKILAADAILFAAAAAEQFQTALERKDLAKVH